MRKRDGRFQRPEPGEITAEFRSMAKTAPGIGVRHLNDYMGAIIPQLFVGTLGVQPLAATVVASKIFTLFCRVPQACVSATFVFYGYEVGRDATPGQLAERARTLVRWSLLPTAVAVVVVLAVTPWLLDAFGGDDLNRTLAWHMVFAYMISVPMYIFEANYGEMLTVHQHGGLLSGASTVVTYLLAVPLAAVGVFALGSPFVAVASCIFAATAVVLYLFWQRLRRDHWMVAAPHEVEVPVA
jgi:Na+-driven multidrug efflux pump